MTGPLGMGDPSRAGQASAGPREQMEGADEEGMTVLSSPYAVRSVPGTVLTVLRTVHVGGQAAPRVGLVVGRVFG